MLETFCNIVIWAAAIIGGIAAAILILGVALLALITILYLVTELCIFIIGGRDAK